AASGDRLLTTVAYQLSGETAYALEGSIFIAGAAVQWLRDQLGAIKTASQSEALAARADPRQRVYFVPAFSGLGAPHWSPNARGMLCGLTADCGLPEIARAVLEAVGYHARDLAAALASDSGLAVDRLRGDGGSMNLLRDLPNARAAESTEALAATPGLRIERIVSLGQTSPPGFWYDQDEAEWVVLLAGAARLRFADETEPRHLGPGDWVA